MGIAKKLLVFVSVLLLPFTADAAQQVLTVSASSADQTTVDIRKRSAKGVVFFLERGVDPAVAALVTFEMLYTANGTDRVWIADPGACNLDTDAYCGWVVHPDNVDTLTALGVATEGDAQVAIPNTFKLRITNDSAVAVTYNAFLEWIE